MQGAQKAGPQFRALFPYKVPPGPDTIGSDEAHDGRPAGAGRRMRVVGIEVLVGLVAFGTLSFIWAILPETTFGTAS